MGCTTCHTCLAWWYFYHDWSLNIVPTQFPDCTLFKNIAAKLFFSHSIFIFLWFCDKIGTLLLLLFHYYHDNNHYNINNIIRYSECPVYVLVWSWWQYIVKLGPCVHNPYVWAGGAAEDGRNLTVTVYLLYLSLFFARNKNHVGDATWVPRVHPSSSSSFFPFTSTPTIHPPSALNLQSLSCT